MKVAVGRRPRCVTIDKNIAGSILGAAAGRGSRNASTRAERLRPCRAYTTMFWGRAGSTPRASGGLPGSSPRRSTTTIHKG